MARPSQGVQDGKRVCVYIPLEVHDAIDSLVAVSGGTSKATFVRQALFAGLELYGLASSDLSTALAATKNSGTTTTGRK